MLIEQKFLIASIFVLSIVVYIQRKEPIIVIPNVFFIIVFLVSLYLVWFTHPIAIPSSSQLDRFSDTYCTSKKLHFINSDDSIDKRLVDDKKRLIIRCIDSQDRIIEFQPKTPVIL